MLENYDISNETYAIIPVNNKVTKIVEKEQEFYVNKSSLDIIKDNCIFYGSSFIGRTECSKSILKGSYKLPIIVEESTPIVFFPVSSPKYSNSIWFSLQNINQISKDGKGSKILFNCGKCMLFDNSCFVLKNQLMRAVQLKCTMYERQRSKK